MFSSSFQARRRFVASIPVVAAVFGVGLIPSCHESEFTYCKEQRLVLKDKLHRQSAANCEKQGQTSSWKLLQSYVVFRHGARTPVFGNSMVSAVDWSGLCDKVNTPPGLGGFSTVNHSEDHPSVRFAHLHVVDEKGHSERPISRVDEIQSSQPMPGGGSCRVGQLTDVGAQQAFELGHVIRDRYSTLGLIQRESKNDDFGVRILARSTNVARCVATLAATLGGILPEGQRQHQPVLVTTRHHKSENLTPNSAKCRNMKLLLDIARDSRIENPSEEAKELQKILKELIPNEAFKALQLDRFNFIRIRDVLVAMETHGIENPYGLSAELVGRICGQGTQDIALYCHSEGEQWEHAVNLGLGRYLKELKDLMCIGAGVVPVPQNMERDSTGPMLYLTAAHDTTILPLLISLHLFDGLWPKFCSSIAFELVEHPASGEAYVRVLYDFEEMLLLKLSEFVEYVDSVAREDWSEECERHIPSLANAQKSSNESMGVGGSHF